MMKFRRLLPYLFAAYFAIAAYGSAHAQVYNRFGPVTGVLKGDVNTYQTTAAASSDVIGLWTGTCNASTFMRADGSCQVPAGTGVTSVAMTVPSGLSVSGSPITSTGTLAVSTTLNGLIHGNGSGFTAGIANVADGGTGVATLTGIAKGSGTSAFTAATSTDVIGTWSGTCNSTTFLRGDGTCAAGAGGSGANPTATIGLTAVNGVAASFIRSDGAPALSQAIVPTWTGVHSFTSTSGTVFGAPTGDNTLRLFATGAAADAKNTVVRTTSTGSFSISRAADASPTTAAADAFGAARSGGAFTAITLGNATDLPYTDVVGGAIIRGLNTTQQQYTAATAVTIGPDSSGSPQVRFVNSAATATNKVWGAGYLAGSTDFIIGANADTGTLSNVAFRLKRSGTTPTVAQFPFGVAGSFLVGPAGASSLSNRMAQFVSPSGTSAAVFQVAAAGDDGIDIHNQDTTGNNGLVGFYTENSAVSRGTISYNRAGGLIVYATTSDRRLKTAITDADSASSIIDALKVRQFEWREPGHDHVRYGFIAQELAEVAPEAVSQGDNGETIERTWGVDPSKLVPVLVKELQDLRKRVADLEAAH